MKAANRPPAICLRYSLLVCVLLLLANCTTTGTPIPPPTQTLIPSTATPIPTRTTPTTTPTPPPGPSDILPTATPRRIQPLMTLEPDTVLDTDLTQRILNDAATTFDVDPAQVQLGRLENWNATNFELGGACDEYAARMLRAVPGFRYTLIIGRDTVRYYTRGASRFVRCESVQPLQDDLLLQADPAAAEMVALARRQVAQQVDLSTRRIDLVALQAYRWPDTSLGCPLPDVVYEQAAIDGYRVLIAAAGEQFIFHTDAATLYPCPAEREQLPAG